MNLDQQVCSLDLAKRLEKLGVKQDSLFGWYKDNVEDSEQWAVVQIAYGGTAVCSAFTVAELGKRLPHAVMNAGNFHLLSCGKTDANRFDIIYQDYLEFPKKLHTLHFLEETTEADARAKMLIYLIENKLIAA